MNISIIYEDDSVIVVNKPAGLIVHGDGRTKEDTLVDWILEKYPVMKGVGEPLVLTSGDTIDRPGIVHRIDRDTSGILVLAKTQDSFYFLKEQFKNRSVKKEYRAFVYGCVKKDKEIIDRQIGKSSKDFRLWSAQRGARGKLREAITEYSVLQRSKEFSYLSVFLKTGRTHQIRVHFKAINHPVVSDKLYAPKREQGLGFSRLALHSFRIELELPNIGRKSFEAPMPTDFNTAVESLSKMIV